MKRLMITLALALAVFGGAVAIFTLAPSPAAACDTGCN
jgi:hypothetical protein